MPSALARTEPKPWFRAARLPRHSCQRPIEARTQNAMDIEIDAEGPEHPFAPYLRTLGRGPGRSRALTREEARDALRMVLRGEAEPLQIGAFLLLLRYRGEDAGEIAGLVEAAREAAGCGAGPRVDLDWPSYGAGRTRGEPYFLLAALALARAGHRIAMHGSNAFTSGVPVAEALGTLGLRPARDRADAAGMLDATGFAYLPLAAMHRELDRLLMLRALLGLRSPINTVARLLNPFDAPASVDGVFHPPYIAVHLDASELLARQRLLVVKGGGGEAERNPAKAMTAHLLTSQGRSELLLPPNEPGAARAFETIREIWLADAPGPGRATVLATIALGLLALGAAKTPEQADIEAQAVWRARGSAG